MKKIQRILHDFGFSENESRVYIAMLKCGEAPISRIAKIAKLNRVTVHHIIKRLESNDLALVLSRNNKKVVQAIHPERLMIKLQDSVNEFEDIVPELTAIMRDNSHNSKPVVRVYRGVAGFEKAADELLEKPNITIKQIGSLSQAHEFIGKKYDLEYFIPTRLAKNISYRSVYYEGESTPSISELREIRYIPKSYNIKANTFIVPGKTIFVTTKDELMTTVIESNDISSAESAKFDLIWDLLENQKS